MNPVRPLHLVLVSLLLCSYGTANAQYAWLDEKGARHFSDMPPPASVPAGSILKQPGSNPTLPATVAPSPLAEKTSESLAEKDAEFRKRRAQQADREKKEAEAARAAAEKSTACKRVREYMDALQSGQRIVHTDGDGERAFLTDEQRTQETRQARSLLRDCK